MSKDWYFYEEMLGQLNEGITIISYQQLFYLLNVKDAGIEPRDGILERHF